MSSKRKNQGADWGEFRSKADRPIVWKNASAKGPAAGDRSSGGKVYELLEMLTFPSMPLIWASADKGETWVWGDYFFTFQKNPPLVANALAASQGNAPVNPALKYHYAMCVFYRRDRCPHGGSARPIMAIGLEQVDYSKVESMLGKKAARATRAEGLDGPGGLVLGMFVNNTRYNLGAYDGVLNRTAVQSRFTSILMQEFSFTGKPQKIGTLDDAHGHPLTGMPAKEKKKMGYGSLMLIAFLIWMILFFLVPFDF